MTFVRTGTVSISDQQLKQYIETYGGRNTSAVSKKTNYLIKGEDPGKTKTNKAEELQVPIISEQEFWNIVVQKSQEMAEKIGIKYNQEKTTFQDSLNPVNKSNYKNQIEQLVDQLGTIQHQDLFWKERQIKVKLNEMQNINNQIPDILNKYTPKTVEQLIGIKKNIDELENAIIQNKLIKICGQHGSGKSILVETVCNDLEYQIQFINGDEDQDELQYKLFGAINRGFNNKKRCMVVDKADYNTLKFNKEIFQFHQKYKNFPLIFIQTEKQNKNTQIISNKCVNIFLTKCKQPTLAKYIEGICVDEHIDFQTGLPNMISSLSEGDFYRALLLVVSSIDISQDQKFYLSREKINNFINFTKQNTWQDYIISIFMYRKFKTQNQQPLKELQNMFYQNFQGNLSSIIQNTGQYTNYDEKYANEVYDLYSLADNVQYQVYQNQQWQVIQSQMVYSTLIPAIKTLDIQFEYGKKFIYPQYGSILTLSKSQQSVQQDLCQIYQGIIMDQLLTTQELNQYYLILQYCKEPQDLLNLFKYYDEDIKQALKDQQDKIQLKNSSINFLDKLLLKQEKHVKQKKEITESYEEYSYQHNSQSYSDLQDDI